MKSSLSLPIKKNGKFELYCNKIELNLKKRSMSFIISTLLYIFFKVTLTKKIILSLFNKLLIYLIEIRHLNNKTIIRHIFVNSNVVFDFKEIESVAVIY